MITVTRFNQTQVVVNADLIEFVERTPDTVITMVTGRKVLVCESAAEVIERVIAYRQAAGRGVLRLHEDAIKDWEDREETAGEGRR